MTVLNASQMSTSHCSVGKATRSNQKDLQVETIRINHQLGHVLMDKQHHVRAAFKLGKK
jgi:hypothetical protein